MDTKIMFKSDEIVNWLLEYQVFEPGFESKDSKMQKLIQHHCRGVNASNLEELYRTLQRSVLRELSHPNSEQVQRLLSSESISGLQRKILLLTNAESRTEHPPTLYPPSPTNLKPPTHSPKLAGCNNERSNSISSQLTHVPLDEGSPESTQSSQYTVSYSPSPRPASAALSTPTMAPLPGPVTPFNPNAPIFQVPYPTTMGQMYQPSYGANFGMTFYPPPPPPSQQYGFTTPAGQTMPMTPYMQPSMVSNIVPESSSANTEQSSEAGRQHLLVTTSTTASTSPSTVAANSHTTNALPIPPIPMMYQGAYPPYPHMMHDYHSSPQSTLMPVGQQQHQYQQHQQYSQQNRHGHFRQYNQRYNNNNNNNQNQSSIHTRNQTPPNKPIVSASNEDSTTVMETTIPAVSTKAQQNERSSSPQPQQIANNTSNISNRRTDSPSVNTNRQYRQQQHYQHQSTHYNNRNTPPYYYAQNPQQQYPQQPISYYPNPYIPPPNMSTMNSMENTMLSLTLDQQVVASDPWIQFLLEQIPEIDRIGAPIQTPSLHARNQLINCLLIENRLLRDQLMVILTQQKAAASISSNNAVDAALLEEQPVLPSTGGLEMQLPMSTTNTTTANVTHNSSATVHQRATNTMRFSNNAVSGRANSSTNYSQQGTTSTPTQMQHQTYQQHPVSNTQHSRPQQQNQQQNHRPRAHALSATQSQQQYQPPSGQNIAPVVTSPQQHSQQQHAATNVSTAIAPAINVANTSTNTVNAIANTGRPRTSLQTQPQQQQPYTPHYQRPPRGQQISTAMSPKTNFSAHPQSTAATSPNK